MQRLIICCVSLFVVVCSVTAGAGEPRPNAVRSIAAAVPAPEGVGLGGVPSKIQVPGMLPADTAGYFRLANIKRGRENFVQAKHIRDADLVQAEFDKLIDVAMLSARDDDGLFGSSGETMREAFRAAQTVHIGMVPSTYEYDFDGPGGNPPQNSTRTAAVVFVELDSMQAIDEHLEKVAEKAQTFTVHGVKVHALRTSDWRLTPAGLCKLDDHMVAIGDTVTALERVLETRGALLPETLGQIPEFRAAYGRYGDGDLFAFVSFDAIRRERETPAILPLFAAMEARADVAGEAWLQFTSAADREYPEFLVTGTPARKLLERVPASAVLVADANVKGGRESREKFLHWVHGELVTEFGLLHELRRELSQAAEQLSQAGGVLDPNIVAEDPGILLLALPIRSEAAAFVAPDEAGQWGGAILCDIDDAAQAQLIVRKFRELIAKEPVKLDWKTESLGGATIHYVDLAELAPPDGLPEPVRRLIDFRVGYAVTDELMIVGTLGSMKHALQPSGASYADRINWTAVDRQADALLSFKAGAVAHAKTGMPQVDAVLTRIAKEIPRDADYTITFQADAKNAVFRSNVPISSLMGWLFVELASESGGPAGLKELDLDF